MLAPGCSRAIPCVLTSLSALHSSHDECVCGCVEVWLCANPGRRVDALSGTSVRLAWLPHIFVPSTLGLRQLHTLNRVEEFCDLLGSTSNHAGMSRLVFWQWRSIFVPIMLRCAIDVLTPTSRVVWLHSVLNKCRDMPIKKHISPVR